MNLFVKLVSEFNEFEPRLKSAKNRFQLSAGLNLEKFNTNLNLSRGSNSSNPALGKRIDPLEK